MHRKTVKLIHESRYVAPVGWVERSETHRPRVGGFRFAQPTLRPYAASDR